MATGCQPPRASGWWCSQSLNFATTGTNRLCASSVVIATLVTMAHVDREGLEAHIRRVAQERAIAIQKHLDNVLAEAVDLSPTQVRRKVEEALRGEDAEAATASILAGRRYVIGRAIVNVRVEE